MSLYYVLINFKRWLAFHSGLQIVIPNIKTIAIICKSISKYIQFLLYFVFVFQITVNKNVFVYVFLFF